MRPLSFVTTAAAMLALAASVMAQGAPAGQQPPAKPTTQAPAPRTPAAGPMASGTVTKYDATTRMLTLTTVKGSETFEIGPMTTIQDGTKKLAAADLGGATGKEATVGYTESGGKKTASSVMLSAAKPAGSTTPAPKPGTPPKPGQ